MPYPQRLNDERQRAASEHDVAVARAIIDRLDLFQRLTMGQRAVVRLRADGVPGEGWADIGARLLIDKSTAYSRFKRAVERIGGEDVLSLANVPAVRFRPPGEPENKALVITDGVLFLDADGKPVPSFSTNTVATAFLGLSAAWLRQQMRLHKGKLPEAHRSKGNDRQFSLADIEKMAYALFKAGAIDQERLENAVTIVLWVARQHGLPV